MIGRCSANQDASIKRSVHQIACLFSMLGMALGSAVAKAAEPASPFRAMMALIEQHCLRCHDSPEAKGGLDLSNHAGWLRGGDGGPVMVPGQPDQSFLLQRIEQGSMPPLNDGRALDKHEIAIVAEWIRAGANWDADAKPARASSSAPVSRFRGPCCESYAGRRRRAIRRGVLRPSQIAGPQNLPGPPTIESDRR
ncbi:MAG: hypothetical protein RIS70_292 [Planctomycetota bacterium]|jgi:mono/diheme cytochrome c family protein